MDSDPTPSSLIRFDARLKKILGGDSAEHSVEPLPKIDRYEVIHALPGGGQSFVYLANDTQLKRRVVLKFSKHTLDEEKKQQLIREGQALSKVRCPEICNCYDVGEFDGHPYLVLEYIAGESLRSYIEQKPLGTQQSLTLFRSIVECLAAVHRVGLVHRDIKPGNILIDQDGRIRLIDFGLTRQLGMNLLDEISGTPAYMAPEQAKGNLDHIDIRTDIFGAGAVLYHLLTGQPPYVGDSRAEVIAKARNVDFVTPREIDADISEDIQAICLRCMSVQQADRYRSAEELIQAIDRCIQTKGVFQKTLWIAIAALLLCLVVGGLLLKSTLFPPDDPGSSDGPRSSSDYVSAPELSQVPSNAIDVLESIVSSGRINDQNRNDFKIKVSFTRESSRENIALSSVQQFRMGELFSIVLKPDRDCYMAIFSVECGQGSATVNQLKHIYPNEITGEAIFLSAKKSESFGIRPSSISTTTEFLLVIASTENWSPAQLKNWFDRDESGQQELREPRLWRGLEAAGKDHKLIFEHVIPYFVK